MKKRNLLLVILAILLVFGMVVSCGEDDGTTGGGGGGGGGGGSTAIAVTFSSLTQDADPDDEQTASVLTLTFNKAITGLTADDITLSGIDVSKGKLNASTPAGKYTLDILVGEAGTLNVAVAKDGYNITGGPKSVTIYLDDKVAPPKYAGNYSCKYWSITSKTAVVESIGFASNQFTIYDDTGVPNATLSTATNYLKFTIEKWETVTTIPTDYSSYSKGFKFTGRIIEQAGYVTSVYTAPSGNGFSDNPTLPVTGCTMYVYYDNAGNFVRTAFTKNTTVPSVVITSTGNSTNSPPAGWDGITPGQARIYKK